MSKTTIADCFSTHLPPLDGSSMTYKTVSASSKTTGNAVPPWCLICKEGRDVSIIVDDCLQRKCITESNILQQPLGTEFPQMKLDNEAELVLASGLYIIRPILEVLQVVFGEDKFHVRSEVSPKTEDLEDLENGQHETQKAVRVDLVFRTNGSRSKVIAVIEYKRREQIRYTNFEPSLLPSTASEDDINDVIYEARSIPGRKGLLFGNASPYTKQVATYASAHNCKHVALLNWDHVLLFYFNKLSDARTTQTTAGPTAELTWVSEQREGQHIQQGNIRKALLGFILQAFEEHFPNQAAE